ncbi:MAG: hypothetical protein MI741_22340, partial [Rhodospirillales bacterium]|nr:hypothetical protein [Rhodospirillales bacterium]
ASSKEAIEEVHVLGSPVASFLKERCVLDPNASTPKDDVWRAWRTWCQGMGMYAGDKRHFGSSLLTAAHGRVSSAKPRTVEGRVPSYVGLRLLDQQAQEVEEEQIPF